MLYVAHFELSKPDENDDGPDLSIGYFSCVAEAENIDAAMDKFEAIITKQREDERLFEGSGSIYLDTCVEVVKMPETGILSHYVEYAPDGMGATATTLPGVDEDCCNAFGMNEPGENEGDEPVEAPPFMNFD